MKKSILKMLSRRKASEVKNCLKRKVWLYFTSRFMHNGTENIFPHPSMFAFAAERAPNLERFKRGSNWNNKVRSIMNWKIDFRLKIPPSRKTAKFFASIHPSCDEFNWNIIGGDFSFGKILSNENNLDLKAFAICFGCRRRCDLEEPPPSPHVRILIIKRMAWAPHENLI